MFSSKDTITSKPSFQRLKKSQEDSEKKSAPLIQKIIRGKIARRKVNKKIKEMKKQSKRKTNVDTKKNKKTNVSNKRNVTLRKGQKKQSKQEFEKEVKNRFKKGIKKRLDRRKKDENNKLKFVIFNMRGSSSYNKGLNILSNLSYTLNESIKNDAEKMKNFKKIAQLIYDYHKQWKAKFGSTSLSVMEIYIMNNYGNITEKQIRKLQGGQSSYKDITDDLSSVGKGVGKFLGKRAKGAKQTIRNLRNKIDTAFDPTPGLKNNTCYKGVQNIITLHKKKILTEKKLEDKEIEELKVLKKAINDFNCNPGKKKQLKLFENQISRILKRGTKVYRDGKNRFTSRLFNKPTKDKTTADYLLKKLIKKKKKEGKRGKKSSTAGSNKSLKLKF